MLFRSTYRGGVWIDLEQPTIAEVQELAKEFSISEHITTELLAPTPTPLVTADEHNILLVLHFPAHGEKQSEIENHEINLVIGPKCIITVRYEVIAPLHHLKKLLETQGLLTGSKSITADVMLEVLFAHLYTAVRDHTNHMSEQIARVEKDMFDGQERKTVLAISDINREFLHMETELANQEDTLARFMHVLIERNLFGASFLERSERILAERTHVHRRISTQRAMASELRKTNLTLLEVKQNEIMKTLTIVNFIFLPLGLITAIFTMHTKDTPIVDMPQAFWIVLVIMLITALMLMVFFIKKRWL